MSDEPAETTAAPPSPDDVAAGDDRGDSTDDTAGDTGGALTGDEAPATDLPSVDAERSQLDLERIESDLAGVAAALRRLDDGTYWTDEVTGEPIPDEVLAADPVGRRAG